MSMSVCLYMKMFANAYIHSYIHTYMHTYIRIRVWCACVCAHSYSWYLWHYLTAILKYLSVIEPSLIRKYESPSPFRNLIRNKYETGPLVRPLIGLHIARRS